MSRCLTASHLRCALPQDGGEEDLDGFTVVALVVDVEAVLAGCFLDPLPERLICDKACGSDAQGQALAEDYGVEMIWPNQSNRKRMPQNGRPLRRYRRRWKIERVFAWMRNDRRLVTRWGYRIDNFLGFMHLACLLMLLRHL